jgi:hypothetical protein
MNGIKLESLSKLTQTKSNSGETVEQYVVGKIAKHFPDALKVQADMPTIEEARQVLIPRMVADLKKLEEGIATMKALVEFDRAQAALILTAAPASTTSSASAAASAPAPPPPPPPSVGLVVGAEGSAGGGSTDTAGAASSSDAAGEGEGVPPPPPAAAELSPIERCLEQAEALLAKASKLLADAQKDFLELCVYLGEEPPGDPEKLFGQIIQFVKGIQAATVVAEAKMKKKPGGGPGGGGSGGGGGGPPPGRPVIKLPNMIQ